MQTNDLPIYEEDAAVSYIRKGLSKELNDRLTNNHILDVIEAIWDYYDSIGATSLNDINDEQDEGLDVDSIAEGIRNLLPKSISGAINNTDLSLIIKGELEYEENLDSCF